MGVLIICFEVNWVVLDSNPGYAAVGAHALKPLILDIEDDTVEELSAPVGEGAALSLGYLFAFPKESFLFAQAAAVGGFVLSPCAYIHEVMVKSTTSGLWAERQNPTGFFKALVVRPNQMPDDGLERQFALAIGPWGWEVKQTSQEDLNMYIGVAAVGYKVYFFPGRDKLDNHIQVARLWRYQHLESLTANSGAMEDYCRFAQAGDVGGNYFFRCGARHNYINYPATDMTIKPPPPFGSATNEGILGFGSADESEAFSECRATCDSCGLPDATLSSPGPGISLMLS